MQAPTPKQEAGIKTKQESDKEENVTGKKRKFQQDIRTFGDRPHNKSKKQGENSQAEGVGIAPIHPVVDMKIATAPSLFDSDLGVATNVGTTS